MAVATQKPFGQPSPQAVTADGWTIEAAPPQSNAAQTTTDGWTIEPSAPSTYDTVVDWVKQATGLTDDAPAEAAPASGIPVPRPKPEPLQRAAPGRETIASMVQPGLAEPGNITLSGRPQVKNADGSVSTELSFSRQDDDGLEVLVPSVVGGKVLSQDEAWDHYLATGEHLGKFKDPESADHYAEQLHAQRAHEQEYTAPAGWGRTLAMNYGNIIPSYGEKAAGLVESLTQKSGVEDLHPHGLIGRTVKSAVEGAQGGINAGAKNVAALAAQELEQRNKSLNLPPHSAKALVGQVVSGITEIAPLMALGPMGAAGAIGTGVYGQTYTEARRAGRSHEEAKQQAALYGLSQGALAMMPLTLIAKEGTPLLPRVLEAMFGGGIANTAATALDIGYRQGVLNEHMTLGAAIGALFDSGIVGAGMGALGGFGGHFARHVETPTKDITIEEPPPDGGSGGDDGAAGPPDEPPPPAPVPAPESGPTASGFTVVSRPEIVAKTTNDIAPTAVPHTVKVRKPATYASNESLVSAIKGLGGLRIRDAKGDITPEGHEIMAALEDLNVPGLINNRTGKLPDQARAALEENGWFHGRTTEQGGTSTSDLYDLLSDLQRGPVYHPGSERGQKLAADSAQAELEARAGVGVADKPEIRAAKIAQYHEDMEIEDLTAKAESLGIPVNEKWGREDLNAAITEREAMADQDELPDLAENRGRDHERIFDRIRNSDENLNTWAETENVPRATELPEEPGEAATLSARGRGTEAEAGNAQEPAGAGEGAEGSGEDALPPTGTDEVEPPFQRGVALPSDIRPPKENIQTVIDSNFTHGGRRMGDKVVPIDTLNGGTSNTTSETKRVRELAAKISGDGGYFERLIIDQDGNVIEGQHRLDALRLLGVKEVPVKEIRDNAAGHDTKAMEDAVDSVGNLHPDQRNAIVSHALSTIHDAGGAEAALRDYELPGFDQHFRAAIKASSSKPKFQRPEIKEEPGAADARGKALPQTIIPGMEKSAQQLAKSREATGRGKIAPKAQQKAPGGLFDEKKDDEPTLFQRAVKKARAETETNPSDAQKEAGNYAKGHVKLHGLDISLETPKGGERTGITRKGEAWRVKMPVDYGYIKRTEGADGEQFDVYVGDNPASEKVFVIDQHDADTKKFDEQKGFLGFNSQQEAIDAYHKSFSDKRGQERVGAVLEMSVPEFKDYLKNGDLKKSASKEAPKFQRADEPTQRNRSLRFSRYLEGEVSLTGKYLEHEEEIIKAVNDVVKKMAPDVTAFPSRRLGATEESGEAGAVYGAFLKSKDPLVPDVIAWSLDSPDAVGTARHEVWHWAEERLTPQERKTMNTYAEENDLIGKHHVETRWPASLTAEEKGNEAKAEDFSGWRRNRRGWPEPIHKIYNKIDLMLRRIAAATRRILGQKATRSDILTAVETGNIAKRATREKGEAKFQRSEKDDTDLVIQHNVTAENLLHAERMGGIPVPSLAITKKDQTSTNFGEITLLGDADLADPQKGTQVYGADIYSPRYPTINHRLKAPALKKLNELLAPYRKDGESQLYGNEVQKPENLRGNKAFDRFAEQHHKDARGYVDHQAAGENLLRKAGSEERIFRGFTNAGNRSYQPHTLENVVKILKKNMRGGEGFNYGVGSLRAKFTPRFSSLSQIKKAKNRILNNEDFKKVKDQIDTEFWDVANKLQSYSDRGKEFGFGDVVIGVMEDSTKIGIPRALKEWQINDVPTDIQEEMAVFLNKLRNLPTEYFEAKIPRVVGIHEFQAAAVPEDVNPEVLALLKSRGVHTETYKRGDEADRRRVVHGLSEKHSIAFQRGTKEPPPRVPSMEPPQEPPKKNFPKYAASINLDLIEGEDDLKQLIIDTAKANNDFRKERREVQSIAQMRKNAPSDRKLLRQLLGRKIGTNINSAETMLAAEPLVLGMSDYLREKMRAAYAGGDKEKADFARAHALNTAMLAQLSGAATEAARTLRVLKEISKARKNAELLKQLIDEKGGPEYIEDIIKRGLQINDPAELAKFMDKTYIPTTFDKVLEYWYNAILSGVTTHEANLIGNLATALLDPIETAGGATLGALSLRKKADRVLYREAAASLFGILQGARAGAKAAGHAFLTGEGTGPRKFPLRQAIKGTKGYIIRTPGRALLAMDELFKAMGRHQQINKDALRTAITENLKGKAYRDRVADLVATPTEEMQTRAEAFARKQTFTSPPGELTKLMQRLANVEMNGMKPLKFIAPFIPVTSNIMKYALERGPAAYAFKHDFRPDLTGKNGPYAKDMARARILVGSSISLAALSWAAQGLMTGAGPDDPEERQLWYMAGNQPNSIQVGDDWVSFNRLEPFATLMGTAATAYEIWPHLSEDESSKMAALLTGAIAKNLSNKTFMQGITDAINAWEDPVRYGEAQLGSLVSSFIPNAVAQYARSEDPYIREMDSILDSVKARIPGLRETLPKRLDAFGKPMKSSDAGFWERYLSPFNRTKVNSDPIVKELMRLDVTIPRVPKKVFGIEMDAEQRTALAAFLGNSIHAVLAPVASRKMTDGAKTYLMKDLITQVHRSVVEAYGEASGLKAKGQKKKLDAILEE